MRLVWIGVGAAVAIAVVYQVGRARSAADAVARTMTTEGVADAVTRGVSELRAVGLELAAAMREHESRLTDDFLPASGDVADAQTYRARRRTASASPWDSDDEF